MKIPKRKYTRAVELLKASRDALGMIECQFFACQGPYGPELPMQTCMRCSMITKITRYLGDYKKPTDAHVQRLS